LIRPTLIHEARITMSFFRRPDYHSEVSNFLSELKVKNPALEAEQRHGRALLWDQPLVREVWSEYRAGQIPQQAYVYQTEMHPLFNPMDKPSGKSE
jgi:hypothetical protein